MPLTKQSINDIYDLIIGDIEAALSQTVPILPKAVLRRIAKALAGAWLILYKYGTQLHRERFVQTASINWLRYLGELVKIYQQTATIWSGTANVVCTGSVGSIDAGTQYVYSTTGVVYIVEVSAAITPGTVVISLYASQSGDIGNLEIGNVLDIVSPISGASMIATIASVVEQGDDAEDIETYRQRVLNAYQKKPQGGAPADYEQWGLEAPNVISIYPYSAALPGQVDIYVEVDNQTDGIPTAPQLTATEDYLLYDPATGRRTRRPVTATLNMYAITRYEFELTVHALSPDTPANRAAIDEVIDDYITERAPYIRGISALRADQVSKVEMTSIIYGVLSPLGATISGLTLEDITGTIDFYILGEGEKAKLGAPINYV